MAKVNARNLFNQIEEIGNKCGNLTEYATITDELEHQVWHRTLELESTNSKLITRSNKGATGVIALGANPDGRWVAIMSSYSTMYRGIRKKYTVIGSEQYTVYNKEEAKKIAREMLKEEN